MAVVVAVLLSAVVSARAQIRIVPRARLDSVANPATVGGGRMVFAEGVPSKADIQLVEFGTLSEDAEPWSRTIEWTNRGSEPLVVTRVTTGCSCVRVENSVQPVRKGQKGRITVTFDPKGRVGGVVQRVWIYTNLSAKTPTAVLELRGRVLSTQADNGYPVTMGDLRLSTGRVILTEGRASVACKNVGSRAMRLTADAMLSTPNISLRTEPEVLNAGAEGVLIVECKGAKSATARKEHPNLNTEPVRLYVGGLELPPRVRRLEVLFEE